MRKERILTSPLSGVHGQLSQFNVLTTIHSVQEKYNGYSGVLLVLCIYNRFSYRGMGGG